MFTIKRKLLCYVILLSIFPLFIVSTLYYKKTIDDVKDKTNQITIETFNEIDNSFFLKSSRIQHVAELITTNDALCDMLRETDFDISSEKTIAAINVFDDFFSRLFINENEIEGVILFSPSGGVYTYNCVVKNKNVVSFATQYGRVDETYGKVSWFDISESTGIVSPRGVFMVGTALYNLLGIDNKRLVANMYVILNDNNLVNFDDNVGTSSIMVYDGNGNFVCERGSRILRDVWNVSLEAGQQIFSTNQGNLQLDIDGENYYCNFYKSPITGWRYIRTMQYHEYFKDFQNFQINMIILIIGILCLIIILNELFVKTITTPLNNLVKGMKEVGSENFKGAIPVTSNDEFGFLCRKFNSMVKRIDDLLSRVVAEERKRKEADILSMQYQIRPHFLYNTLSSIRLFAYFKGEEEISEMLFIMGRFLRNTIHNAGCMMTIDEEIRNIKDYIALYKIRYKDGFEFLCETDENIGNYKIPAMMIQPIIENSFFHGLNTKIDGIYEAKVKLSVRETEKGICIAVWDNGIGIEDNILRRIREEKNKVERIHIGIANTEKRIHDMFGEDYGISITSESNRYTQVEIALPKITDEAEMESNSGFIKLK